MSTVIVRPKDKTCPECGKGGFSAQGLGAHRRFAHGVKGANVHGSVAKKKNPSRALVVAANRPVRPVIVVKHESNGAAVRPAKAAKPAAPAVVCFCPRCGTNIRAVSLALAFAERSGR